MFDPAESRHCRSPSYEILGPKLQKSHMSERDLLSCKGCRAITNKDRGHLHHVSQLNFPRCELGLNRWLCAVCLKQRWLTSVHGFEMFWIWHEIHNIHIPESPCVTQISFCHQRMSSDKQLLVKSCKLCILQNRLFPYCSKTIPSHATRPFALWGIIPQNDAAPHWRPWLQGSTDLEKPEPFLRKGSATRTEISQRTVDVQEAWDSPAIEPGVLRRMSNKYRNIGTSELLQSLSFRKRHPF